MSARECLQPDPIVLKNSYDGMLTCTSDELAEEIASSISSPDRPKIVCLCGSTRFPDAFNTAIRSETLAGRIVLSVGCFGHQESFDMGGPIKAALDQLHLHKIALADEVLILNVGGYIGDSTRREIEHARRQNKPLRWLENPAGNGATTTTHATPAPARIGNEADATPRIACEKPEGHPSPAGECRRA